jgi:alkylation response protein AidB-like acyl-CoA dehydrogenase
MDVLLNEEEELVRQGAREFFEGECPPDLAREMDQDDLGYPAELWKKMAENGWIGLALPEQYGGQGLPLNFMGLVFQEIGRVIAPVPLHSTLMAALAIASDGTEEQKNEILPKVSNGEIVLTWALLETSPRYLNPADIHMEATEDGEGFALTGTKMFVENFTASDKCIVACRTGIGSSGSDGISLFIVDTNSPGLSQNPLVTISRDKQSQVIFDKVKVSKTALVGELNNAWAAVELMVDKGTILLCAQLLGAARKHAEMAIEYSKNRYAFGRPIGSFQSIAHTCTDMIIWVDGGELLTFEALWRLDEGLPASVEVSQAKAFCNEHCMPLGRLANAVHGGMSFMEEYNPTLWFRRIEAMTLKLGSTGEHRARVAKALLDTPGHVQLGEDLYNLAAS